MWFLHNECGYTFNENGVIENLHDSEEQMLWHGRMVWHEEFEQTAEQKKSRERKQASKQMFEQHRQQQNSAA